MNLGYAVWAYILDMVPLAVLALMTIMINQLVKNSTFAMFLAIIVYIGLNVLGIYFSNLSGLVFTGYMQWHKPVSYTHLLGVLRPTALIRTGI